MGMPISLEIADPRAGEKIFDRVFDYFTHIDETFSTYKETSEISAINSGRLAPEDASPEMRLVLMLSEETKQLTRGFFDIRTPEGRLDPSGLVKGWSIWNAAQLILKAGFADFYVDAGGDIQPHGRNAEGESWSVGIKNPWNQDEHVKIVKVTGEDVATSGTYVRGPHIYNPLTRKPAEDIASLTVIGPNVYEADRIATAAFAMGTDAAAFVESLPGFETYMIRNDRQAVMTSGFERFAAA